MSDSSRVQVSHIKESSWGVTPAGSLQVDRVTGESLKYNIGTEVSAEIRSDRMKSDLVQTSFDANGDLNFESSFNTQDDYIESVLYSTFSTAVAVSETDISADSADNSYNTAGGDFTTENLFVGQWIKVAGFAINAINNSYGKIVSITTGKIVVSGVTLITETAGDTITMKGSMIRNGTTQLSLSIEKYFSDITEYMGFRGMTGNTYALNLEARAVAKGVIGFTGKDAVGPQATTIGTGYTNATSTNIFSVGSHVKNVRENAALLSASAYAKALNFSLNNNNRFKDAVGEVGAVGIGSGSIDIIGTLTAYFESEALYEKFINNTASSIDYRTEDAAGNAYIYTFPNIKYSDGNVAAGAINEDVVVDLTFEALEDTTTSAMMQIDRIPI